jgi:hypothetical protein
MKGKPDRTHATRDAPETYTRRQSYIVVVRVAKRQIQHLLRLGGLRGVGRTSEERRMAAEDGGEHECTLQALKRHLCTC